VSFLYKNYSFTKDNAGNQLEMSAFKLQRKGNRLKPRRDITAIWVLAHCILHIQVSDPTSVFTEMVPVDPETSEVQMLAVPHS